MKILLNKEQIHHLIDMLEVANEGYLEDNCYRLLSKAQKQEAIEYNNKIIKKLNKSLGAK